LAKLFALGALLVLVLLGSRRRPEHLRLPAGLRLLFVTGTEYIIVGALLGPAGFGVLDDTTLAGLSPFAAVGLGFVGLHFGMQLEASVLRWIPLFYNVAPIVHAAGGALLVGGPALWLFWTWQGPGRETIAAAMILAAAAACSSPAPLEMLFKLPRYAGSSLLQMLRHLAEMGELPALALLTAAVCYRHPTPIFPDFPLPSALQWFTVSLALGVVFGLALSLLPRLGREGTGRLLVGVVSAVLFFAGVARFLHLSPLVVSLFAGITVVNLPGPQRRVYRLIARLERPFLLMLLLLAGASWRPAAAIAGGLSSLLLLAAGLIALRILGKYLAGQVLARTTHAPRQPPPNFGLGLAAQGGIAAAIALDYLQAGTAPVSQLVVTIILVSVVVTEITAPWLILRVLAADKAASTPREEPG
jgi:Kef-type K+ transport system membrane component KefB